MTRSTFNHRLERSTVTFCAGSALATLDRWFDAHELRAAFRRPRAALRPSGIERRTTLQELSVQRIERTQLAQID